MKKGFTLVELLAVIAILAILVIIALPNVMGMFNNAKKNAFTTEIKEVYKVAQQTWMSDSLFNTGAKEYARCKSGCNNPLDLTGRDELEYYIKIDKSGRVTNYYASDGTYQYSYDSGDLKIEGIRDVQNVAGLNDDQVLTIGPRGITAPTAVSYFNYYDNGEGVTITRYSSEGPKDVIIPKTIDGKPVTYIDTNAFSYRELTSVSIPDTVQSIDGSDDLGAFAYNRLTTIDLPESLEHIGTYAFAGNNIKKVVIPNKVKTIDFGAFTSCGIEELVLGNSVERIDTEAFAYNNITTLTIPASVKWISPGFEGYYVYHPAFEENPLRSVTIKGKSSASQFETPYRTTLNSHSRTPFAWASDVTCVKDNDSNVANGCITWEP